MALHILPREQNTLGQNAAQGLSNLIDRKINELQQNKIAQNRREVFKKANLPEWLADMPENLQEIFIKEFQSLPEDQKEMARQEVDQITQKYWNDQQNKTIQQQPSVPHTQQPFWGARPVGSELTPSGAEVPLGKQPPAEDFGKNESRISGLNNLMKAGEGFEREPAAFGEVQMQPRLGHGTQGQAVPPEEPMAQPRTGRTFEERGYVRKGQNKANGKQLASPDELNREAFKDTKEIRADLLSKYQVAKSINDDLNRMEELQREGKLDTPGYVEFLNRSGLDIPALMEEGSEEFNKIQANFLRQAKDYYGGRVTNYEVEQFLKTVPSLSQSPEGRKRVIAVLKNLNRAAIERYKTSRDIVQKNGGRPPLDLAEQVEDRLDKKMDSLYREFKKDLNKKVPQGQNRYITALQASLGSVLGAPGKVLSAVGNVVSKAVPAP